MPNVGRKKGKRHKFKDRNNGPARRRYWETGRLEQNKVKAIVRATGMSVAEARKYWRAARQGRKK